MKLRRLTDQEHRDANDAFALTLPREVMDRVQGVQVAAAILSERADGGVVVLSDVTELSEYLLNGTQALDEEPDEVPALGMLLASLAASGRVQRCTPDNPCPACKPKADNPPATEPKGADDGQG